MSIIFKAAVLSLVVVANANTSKMRTCVKINSNADFESAINDESNRIILTCPFKLDEDEIIDIQRSDFTVVCSRENVKDKCEFKSGSSHLNINGDSVTFVGFDFLDSRNGAVHIEGKSVSFIDCSFENNKRWLSRGGAVEIHDSGDGALMVASEFSSNYATEGGAIYTHSVTKSTVINSTFKDNNAERGGAMSVKYGKSIQNDFQMNSATFSGSVIFNNVETFCDGGSNYACSGPSYVPGSCDGIFKDDSCAIFSNVCEYPSDIPSMEPTSTPSFVPSSSPSANPTISIMPTITPTYMPSITPSSQPSKPPSSTPSAKPSSYPSTHPSVEPSRSSAPTVVPSQSPTQSPSLLHSESPSAAPSKLPSLQPSEAPTGTPSSSPSLLPSTDPSSIPTTAPSVTPSQVPSQPPTGSPSEIPSLQPSEKPSIFHSSEPSNYPTLTFSDKPSNKPSTSPTVQHSLVPSVVPSTIPTQPPSGIPSQYPSTRPSQSPSSVPTISPTYSVAPSLLPSKEPSVAPTLSMQPTLRCNMDGTDRNELIFQILSGTGKRARQHGTVQNDALQWILNEDQMHLCPNSENLIQRFAAAVVTKGLRQDKELSNSHECRWEGIECNHNGEIKKINLDKMPGVLTREISLLSQLRSLVLEEGKLNYLPGNILEVPKLQNLDLDKNRIRGEFQSGNTTNSEMLRLDINYNSFSGSLDFLSNMPNLKEAHLDNNKFDGTIPEVIGTLSNLEILTLHKNKLSGSIPESICQLRAKGKLVVLTADCGGKSPKVDCVCCTHCFPIKKPNNS